MLIAFDIDDTLGDLTIPAIGLFNRIYGRDFSLAYVLSKVRHGEIDPRGDFFSQLYGVSPEEVTCQFAKWAGEIYATMDSFPQARETVNAYREQGHEIVYITARNSLWREVTQMWLVTNGFPESDIYFDEQKVDLAVHLGVQLFYEDNVRNILNLTSKGIRCNLVHSIQNSTYKEEDGVTRLYWNPNLGVYPNQVEESILGT